MQGELGHPDTVVADFDNDLRVRKREGDEENVSPHDESQVEEDLGCRTGWGACVASRCSRNDVDPFLGCTRA